MPSSIWALAVLVLAMAVAASWLMYSGRGLIFFYDEWDFIFQHRAWSVDSFFAPANEHLSVVPVLVFKLLYVTVGLDDYWVFRMVLVAVHMTVVGLLFVYAARRIGRWAALVPALLLMFLGSSWHSMLAPAQIAPLLSLAAGIGALMSLDRRSRMGDMRAAGLLVVALGASSVGIPVLLVLAVELARSDDRRQRAWIAAVPFLLYLAWYIGYTPEGDLRRSNLVDGPEYLVNLAATAFGGIFGLAIEWGRILLVAAIGAMAWRLSKLDRLPDRLAALLVGLASFWAMTAFARAHFAEPTANRYIYPGVVLILLVAVELTPRFKTIGVRFALISATVLAGAILANMGDLRDGRNSLLFHSQQVKASLVKMERAGPAKTDPDFRPAPTSAPQITAERYFPAIRELGSPLGR